MAKSPSMNDVFTSGPKIGHKRKDGNDEDEFKPAEKFVAPKGYRAYHGTSSENVESILRDGLVANYRAPDDWPKGDLGFVCFTEDADICEDYGDATIEADLSGMEVRRFWDVGDGGGCWEVQVDGSIPAERLKLYGG